jgi:hypothetical protein
MNQQHSAVYALMSHALKHSPRFYENRSDVLVLLIVSCSKASFFHAVGFHNSFVYF